MEPCSSTPPLKFLRKMLCADFCFGIARHTREDPADVRFGPDRKALGPLRRWATTPVFGICRTLGPQSCPDMLPWHSAFNSLLFVCKHCGAPVSNATCNSSFHASARGEAPTTTTTATTTIDPELELQKTFVWHGLLMPLVVESSVLSPRHSSEASKEMVPIRCHIIASHSLT